jgi:hypothetical protein
MNQLPVSNGQRAIMVVITGVAAIAALVGVPSMTYWGSVWMRRASYHSATFQVEDAWLSGSQRNSRRFWMAKGKVDEVSESLSIRWKKDQLISPFMAGKAVQVHYNPRAIGVLFNGRSLRVLVLDDYLAAGRNFVMCLAGFLGPGIAVALIWFWRRLRRGSVNAAVKHRGAIQAGAVVVALACSGCGRSEAPTPGGVEGLSEDLRAFYDRGDTNALVAQVSTNDLPSVLLDAMKQSLLLPVSLGKVEVQSSKVFPVSEYKPTTGVPGVFEGKNLRWAVMPTHWVVLETRLLPPDIADGGQPSMNIKLEFAVAEINGRWRIIGPAYDD